MRDTIDRTDHAWVQAAPFRAHVRHLIDATGIPWRAVAIAARVPPASVRTLLAGREGRLRPRISRRTAECLMAVRVDDLREARFIPVPAARTGRMLSALRRQGLSWEELAAMLGTDAVTLARIAAGGRRTCPALLELLAEAACGAHQVTTRDEHAVDDAA